MPSYFEMLQRADLSTMTEGILTNLKAGGIFLALALLLEGLAVMLLLAGGAAGVRNLLLFSGVSAAVAALLGLLGSLLGYSKAVQIVASASVKPRDADLDGAANHLLFAVGVPVTITAVLFVMIGVVWAVRQSAFKESTPS